MTTEKMGSDEMYENGKSELEAGLGEQDEKLTRKVLLKMDSRYAPTCFSNCIHTARTDILCNSVSSQFSHSCSCVLSSTERMSATRKSWVSRRVYTSMTISTRLGCVCFMRRTSQGTFFRASTMGCKADSISSELPSNLVLKKMSPKIWLPLLTTVWGILTMCLGFVPNFGSFVTVRALLGVAEGGLLPGMVSAPYSKNLSYSD
jgi:hypothetical protein